MTKGKLEQKLGWFERLLANKAAASAVIFFMLVLPLGYGLYRQAVAGTLGWILVVLVVGVSLLLMSLWLLSVVGNVFVCLWPRPRTPNHICPVCLSLRDEIEESNLHCPYCWSNHGPGSDFEPITTFLDRETIERLLDRRQVIRAYIGESWGQRLNWPHPCLCRVNRVIRLKRRRDAIHRRNALEVR